MTREGAYEEAKRALRLYVRMPLVGGARKAYDRLVECGMTERSLGKVEEWDEGYARELLAYLEEE